jgi:hypothetical protein
MKVRNTGLALLLAAGAAGADEIVLANGGKVQGVVLAKTADAVTVEVKVGTVTFRPKDVTAINPGRTDLHEFRDRRAALGDAPTAADLFALAQWAERKGLSRSGRELCEQVVRAEPDHAGARGMLGHEKAGARWLTRDEARLAKGLVPVDGRWVTPAEAGLAEARRLEAEERRLDRERERAERAEEQRRRREVAEEARRMRLEAVLGGLDGYFYSPSFAFTTPYFRPYGWASYARSRRMYQEGWRAGSGYVPFDVLDLWRRPIKVP